MPKAQCTLKCIRVEASHETSSTDTVITDAVPYGYVVVEVDGTPMTQDAIQKQISNYFAYKAEFHKFMARALGEIDDE